MSITRPEPRERPAPTREERLRALRIIRDYFARKAEFRAHDGLPAGRERGAVETLDWAIGLIERAPDDTPARPATPARVVCPPQDGRR